MENVEQGNCINVENVLLQYQCKSESIQNAEMHFLQKMKKKVEIYLQKCSCIKIEASMLFHHNSEIGKVGSCFLDS